MEFAISTSYNYKLNLIDNLRAISEAGFKFISIGGNTAHSGYHKPEGRVKLRKYVQELGLTIDSLHAPFDPSCDLTHLQEIFAKGAVIEIKRVIQAAADLEVPHLIFHLNSFRPSHITERLQVIKRTLPQVIKCAEDYNVIIALENLDSSSQILFNFALDLFDSPNLAVCYDNGHEMLNSDTFEVVQKYGQRIKVIHLHDNDGVSDLHLVPFEGKLNLPILASRLNKLTKIPRLTLECEMPNSSYKSADAFLKASYDSGLRFCEMLKT